MLSFDVDSTLCRRRVLPVRTALEFFRKKCFQRAGLGQFSLKSRHYNKLADIAQR
jgi:hypothetical protein